MDVSAPNGTSGTIAVPISGHNTVIAVNGVRVWDHARFCAGAAVTGAHSDGSYVYAVLAIVTVGDDGTAFLPNAAAKAAGHRRLGRNYGEAVLTDPHLCGDGNFRYGHSAQIRGQIVGASSQSTDQDVYEAAALATDFVGAIAERHLSWEERVGPGEWLAQDGSPASVYREMIGWFPSA